MAGSPKATYRSRPEVGLIARFTLLAVAGALTFTVYAALGFWLFGASVGLAGLAAAAVVGAVLGLFGALCLGSGRRG